MENKNILAAMDACGELPHGERRVAERRASHPAAPVQPGLSDLKKLQIVAGCAVDDLEQIHAALGFPDDQTIDVDDMIWAIKDLQSAQAALLVQQTSDVRGQNGAKMPCGAFVTNVYEAYEAGRRATTRPSAALTDERIMHIAEDEAITWVTDEGRPDNSTIISFARAILAASGGALAVPGDVALDAARYRRLRDKGDTEGQPPVMLGGRWHGGSNGVGFNLDKAMDTLMSAPTQDQGEGNA